MLIDPVELLDDCERMWSAMPPDEARQATPGLVHRTGLVIEALMAYALLARAAGLDEGVVADRWPACTVRAAARIAVVDTAEVRRRAAHAAAELSTAHPELALDAFALDVGGMRHRWRRAADRAAFRLLPAEPAGETSSRFDAWPVADSGAPPDAAQTSQAHRSDSVAVRQSGAASPPLPAPELRLGPGGSGVVLALPDLPDDAGPWQLAADGRTFTAAPPYWSLPGPVRRIDVSGPARTTWTLLVVDPSSALLAFDADGRLLPPHEALPPTDLTLLHADVLETDGSGGARLELPVPYGWGGWTMTRLSLTGVRRVRVGADAGAPWRDVASGAALGWEGGRTVPCLQAPDGAAVWGTEPALRLPRRKGETTGQPWEVTVHRPGEAAALARLTGMPGSLIEPWRDVPRPLLGPYEIRVHRPGRALRARRVTSAFLAEGVMAEPSAQWRQFGPRGGLSTATVRIEAGPLAASRRSVPFGSYEIATPLVLRDARGAAHEVDVRIPHSELRLEIDAAPGAWSIRPLDIDAAALMSQCVLTVRLPDRAVDVEPTLALVVDGVRLHTLCPQRRGRARRGDLRYVLSALADTVRDWSDAEVHLLVAGQDLTVATVRTLPIAREAVAEGDGLRLRGGPAAGASAHLYQVLAPWRPPAEARADEQGRIPLPPQLRDAGPLIVRLRTGAVQPDGAPPWPDLRHRDTLVVRRAPWRPSDRQSVDAAMTSYLAGHGALPEWAAHAAPRMWTVAARGRDLQACGVYASAPAECLAALRRAGIAALHTAAGSGLSTAEIAPVLVGSGLAALRVREVATPDAVRELWRRTPLCALLLTAPLLPYLAGGGAYDVAELYPDEVELLDEVREFAGDSVRMLLPSEVDPHRGTGRFDGKTRFLAELPDPQQQALWASVGIVPRALLDQDTRMAAAWQAFRARDHFRHVTLQEEGGEWADALGRLLTETAVPLADALRDRDPGPLRGLDEAWLRVPQLSLGFALVARLAAAGDSRAAKLERGARPAWTALASRAPELTAVDLTLAELLVTKVRLQELADSSGQAPNGGRGGHEWPPSA